MEQNKQTQPQHERWEHDRDIHNCVHDAAAREAKSRQQVAQRSRHPQRKDGSHRATEQSQSNSRSDLRLSKCVQKLAGRCEQQVGCQQQDNQQNEAGGKAAAIAYTLIGTAKLNAVDPLAWLADTLARIPDYKITKVEDPLPWRWVNRAGFAGG